MTVVSACVDHGSRARGERDIRMNRSAHVFGVLLLLLIAGALLVPSAEAQDRSVPRFGPLVSPDTVQTGPFDFGRLWSFAHPPLDYVEKQYRVSGGARGIQHARLGTVRLPDCSGALVSPQGLVLTAARCVAGAGGDEQQEEGAAFYAEDQQDEQPLETLFAERVVEVRDVTGQVDSLVAEAGSAEQDTSVASAAAVQLQRRLQAEAPDQQSVDVVREAGGERYVAYYYQRYDDVRLVFRPDPQVQAGVQEMLTYPQHTWGVAVLRIYEDGTPLSTDTHFELRPQGARPGDAVFAVGFPGDTYRAETYQQLAFRRDVTHPDHVARLDNWTTHVQHVMDTTATRSLWRQRFREGQGALKRTRAQLESLQNRYVMTRLQRRDEALRREEGTRASQVMEELETLQAEKREYVDRYQAFSFLLHPEYSSATLQRALHAYQAMNDARSRSEASGSPLQAVSAQPPALDKALLADHLHRLQTHLAVDSALGERLAQVNADEIVENSVLSEPEAAQTAFRNREVPSDDPAIALMAAVHEEYAAFRDDWTELQSREQRLTDRLSSIRHRSLRRPVHLPRSRALRLADGRIQGYSYNGTLAPPFTTFYGLYGHHSAPGEAQALPERWQDPANALDRSTPLTTVASTDLGAGEYGGPLLNSSLQLVGIVVDGNVQSAAGTFLFLPRRMRSVSIDIRGVLEGLSDVYEAEALVQEMTTDSVSRR